MQYSSENFNINDVGQKAPHNAVVALMADAIKNAFSVVLCAWRPLDCQTTQL